MSEIKAVLLVPEEGDPHGLLKDGPCGARPPTAWMLTRESGRWYPGWAEDAQPYGVWQSALVLAWDGKPVAEAQPYIERAGIDYALLAPFVAYALKGMDIGQGPWPGTLVLVDAEGQEVSDE
jgi:hypothetical protein